MAQRHWLDPLARQLLIASGQLRPPRDARATSGGEGDTRPDRSGRRPAQASQAAQAAAGTTAQDLTGSDPLDRDSQREEEIERDLLALQLARQPGRPLRDAQEVRRAAALGWRLDVNRATAADWLRLPGCTAAHADLLLRLQAGGVQLSGPEDLQRLLSLEPAVLRSWLPLLEFRWYGAPPEAQAAPIAINAAAPAELGRLPELDRHGLARLLAERRRRPFEDLADLQQRLGLPAGTIEAWIGRVSFAPPPPGPSLPPAPRSR